MQSITIIFFVPFWPSLTLPSSVSKKDCSRTAISEIVNLIPSSRSFLQDIRTDLTTSNLSMHDIKTCFPRTATSWMIRPVHTRSHATKRLQCFLQTQKARILLHPSEREPCFINFKLRSGSIPSIRFFLLSFCWFVSYHFLLVSGSGSMLLLWCQFCEFLASFHSAREKSTTVKKNSISTTVKQVKPEIRSHTHMITAEKWHRSSVCEKCCCIPKELEDEVKMNSCIMAAQSAEIRWSYGRWTERRVISNAFTAFSSNKTACLPIVKFGLGYLESFGHTVSSICW